MAHVAVLGTGLLGAGFVEGMRRRGDAVRVWNRTAARAEALRPLGVEVAPDPAAAVRGAARVHLVLSDDAAVDAVLDAAAPALDAVVVDHSTVSPGGVVRRAARFGARYVHAPVFMAPQNARDGTGILLVSGPAAVVDALLPELRRLTGKVLALGERVDLAAAYKLFGNSVLFALVAAAADVTRMARALDVDPADALRLFETFDPSPTLRLRGARIARQQFLPASFEVAMARKDAGLMLEVAGEAELLVVPSVARRLDALLALGHGELDLAALGRL